MGPPRARGIVLYPPPPTSLGLHLSSKKIGKISVVFEDLSSNSVFFWNPLTLVWCPLFNGVSERFSRYLVVRSHHPSHSPLVVMGFWQPHTKVRGGGSKTKEISMKNIGVKVLITNRIIWNSKQTKNKKQAITSTEEGGGCTQYPFQM